jgi:NAD(P)-dependent dehydrogenase (short-subunit alcohol dehydrogenase family)
METVLLTGSCRGFGDAIRNAFTERDRDYNLVLTCRDTKADYAEINPDHTYIVFGDLMDPWVITELGKVALKKGVGILINNAAIYTNKSFDQMEDGEIRRIIETDLTVPMLLTRAVWPSFKARGGGLVININSLAGLTGGNGETAYCAAKHGLAGFSKALQFDGTRDNVRIVNMYVGAMKTDMTANRPDWDKFIDPYEVAELIVWLCRDHKSLRITELTVVRRNY